jgi:hypothetical protein
MKRDRESELEAGEQNRIDVHRANPVIASTLYSVVLIGHIENRDTLPRIACVRLRTCGALAQLQSFNVVRRMG